MMFSTVQVPCNKVYRCGEVDIRPAEGAIRVRGTAQHIRPKSFELLEYLIVHRNRLVARNELLDEIWKDTSVNPNAPAQCVIELRRALGDDPRNPRFIKTSSKLGYQFIGLVEEAVEPGSAALELEEVVTTQIETEEGWRLGWILAAILGVLLAGLILLWRFSPLRPETALPEVAGKRPVVVMYFENQSKSAELDWLREGLADMLIANLSRSTRLSLLSRQQLALTLTRSRVWGSPDLSQAMQIARGAQANAMILGSFARLGDQVRITTQIVNARDGQTIARETITASHPEQILVQMDTLALELASDLGTPLAGRGSRVGLATLRTNNLEAYRDYGLGLEMANCLHHNEAIALFKKAVALDPGFSMAQARIGYTLAFAASHPVEARPFLEKAFAASSNLTQLDRLHIAAWYAVAKLDYNEAIQRYRDLLAADPGEMEAYGRLGRLLRGEDRREEAVEILKQGLTFDPDATDILNVLGAIYAQLGRHDEAIRTEQRYVALAPQESNAHDSLALAYHWAGRHAEAEREYERAIQLKPDFDIALRHLGTLYLHTGRYRAALHQMELALQAQPGEFEHNVAHAFASAVRAQMGDWDGAAEEGRKVNRLVTTLAAIRKGDLDQADAIVAALPNPNGNDRGARSSAGRTIAFMKGQIALARNHPEEAIADFQEALRHWVQWSDPIWLEDCLADAYLRLGRLDEAIMEYQRALRLYPGMALTRFHLAEAYRKKGDRTRAAAEYHRFLELWSQADPGIPEVAAARAAIAN
ncbi:MAG: tetratricopeptide repeat protein [Bryobacteraceae bacterium]|jgi:tetratricopeptide (TPR) repeat protein